MLVLSHTPAHTRAHFNRMLGGDGGGRVGGEHGRLVRKVARLVRMAEREQAAGYGARAI